ncbi:MAG: endonuclease/exonuclease/phosphatase family protein [candidate division WOR-3 bacterium]
MFWLRWLVYAVVGPLVVCGCERAGRPNRAPAVVIVTGPHDPVVTEGVRFEWVGTDLDGAVVGYFYGLDDSVPEVWTESSGVTLLSLEYGVHDFFVQAVDDSGARSVAAVWTFSYEFSGALGPAGTDTTFDLVTWNIENFPKAGSRSVSHLRALMEQMEVDLFALQEIADTLAFRNLVSSLDGYYGRYSPDSYGSSYQKTGVVYRVATVSVFGMRQLFVSSSAFPRPPIEMFVRAVGNGQVFDFRLIVLHLKAGSTSSDRERRRTACRLLKEYIDAELESGSEPDFVVAGDWNDQLDDPVEENVFQPFLEDTTRYCFLTRELTGDRSQASYIGGGLIDHILVTRDALAEYRPGVTRTLRLDDRVRRYQEEVSDHRPVLAGFSVFRPTGLCAKPAEE